MIISSAFSQAHILDHLEKIEAFFFFFSKQFRLITAHESTFECYICTVGENAWGKLLMLAACNLINSLPHYGSWQLSVQATFVTRYRCNGFFFLCVCVKQSGSRLQSCSLASGAGSCRLWRTQPSQEDLHISILSTKNRLSLTSNFSHYP